MPLQPGHPILIFGRREPSLKGWDTPPLATRSSTPPCARECAHRNIHDLPPDRLPIVLETPYPDERGTELDQDLRNKEKQVGKTDWIGFWQGHGRPRLGFTRQIIGKMPKKPFSLVPGPCFKR